MQSPFGIALTRGHTIRAGIVLAGLVLGQVILYGPSLFGNRILLPIDLLALPDVYLPRTAEAEAIEAHYPVLSDQVFVFELSRRFAAREFRAGRLPLWIPYQHAGVPFARWEKYSPFNLIYYCFPTPRSLAWIQLFKSIIAGVGAFLFFRCGLKVSFWPATIGAWCFPLTGVFVLWQGYGLTFVTALFPWLLLATGRVVRLPGRWSAMTMSLTTCLVVISGQVDVAGQALIASGLYAVWCAIDRYGRGVFTRRICAVLMTTVSAWIIGLMLTAPFLLPAIEYARTGVRMQSRSAGQEERPPVGLSALPRIVLPDIYGSRRQGSFHVAEDNLLESSAAAYTGLIATMFLAPLGWCNRRLLSINLFWLILGFVGLSWILDIWPMVALWRLPLLNMMSHNRFVFVSSFAILATAVAGLDTLASDRTRSHWWSVIPIAVLSALGGWCWYRSMVLPEPMATELGRHVQIGPYREVRDLAEVDCVQQRFTQMYLKSAGYCILAIGAWLTLWLNARRRTWVGPAVSTVIIGELLWFAYGFNPQCNAALNYPPIGVLRDISKLAPGRILGVGCLPSRLGESHGLYDIRGYDGVDPARLMDLMENAKHKASPSLSYSKTQWFMPRMQYRPPDSVELPPILDMLNVKYLIFRGHPPPNSMPILSEPDYWVLRNPRALPRVYVPEKVQTVQDDDRRLTLMGTNDFNPRRIAYVERVVALPDECRGQASILDELPRRVSISLEMQTPGLVVLADLWDPGWRAMLNGRPIEVLRVNHAIRGVVVPAGHGTLEFSFTPTSFTWGVGLMLVGFAVLAIWIGFARSSHLAAPPQSAGVFRPARPCLRACPGA